MNLDKKFLLKRVLPVAAGAAIGYAYYYFIGCNNGHCLIQSNPYYSTLYGAALGGIFAMPGSKKKKKENENDGNN